VVVTMFVASVLTAVFVSFGVAGVLFVVTLGLAAFGGGKPTENGRTAAPERWLH
jgi:hypothetical protein